VYADLLQGRNTTLTQLALNALMTEIKAYLPLLLAIYRILPAVINLQYLTGRRALLLNSL